MGGLFRTRAWLSGKIVVTIFVLLVYYSYLLAPDWMFMYFAKEEIPRWVVFYILVLYYFAYAAGFFLKFELEKIRKGLALAALVVTLAGSVLVVLSIKDRYWRVGTLEEFQAGRAIPLSESPVGRVPGTLSLLLLPLGVGLLLWSRRQKF